MASLLRRVLPAKDTRDDLPKEVRALLAKLRKEKAQMTELLGRVDGAGANLALMTSALEAAASRAESVEGRLDAIERRTAAVDALDERVAKIQGDAEALERSGDRFRERVDGFGGALDRVQQIVRELEEGTRAARELHSDLDGLTATAAALDEVTDRADRMQERFQALDQGLLELREEQRNTRRAQEEAAQRAQETTTLSTRLKAEVGESAGRIAQLEVTLRDAGRLQQLSERTQQDLRRLNSLAEHITQKTRSLEQQREVVDRAAAQTERLDALVWDLDSRLKKLQEDGKQIRKLQSGMADVQELTRKVATQERDIRSLYTEKRDEEKELASRYEALRRQVDEGLERFSIESAAVASVTNELADLRAGLSDFEARFHALEGSGRAIARAQSHADELAARLSTIAADVARVDEQAERVQTVETGLRRIETAATALDEGIARLEAREPSVREMADQLADVRGRIGEVQEAHRWLQTLGEEIDQVRSRHMESLSTIETVDRAVQELDTRMATVQGLTRAVEVARTDASRALSMADELSQREQFLTRLHDRIAGLGTLSSELDERFTNLEARRTVVVDLQARSESLQQRLEDAESRFSRVARQAEEVEQVETRLASAAARIQDAETRLDGLRHGLEAAESGDAEIRALAERATRLGQELARRESDLQSARTELEQIDGIRRTAVTMAQELDEQVRGNAEQLARADAHAGKVSGILQQLEERASGLRFTENRLARFEEKLATLETAGEEIGRSIDALNERQRSVDAVRDDLGRIFAIAERTLGEVRAITDSRQDIHEAGAKLDETLRRVQELDGMLSSLDDRHAAIEGAEQEAFRLEALIVDVQNSLETVRGQKTIVDLAVEKAGQLTFQVKEAEALLHALREERELTNQLRTNRDATPGERPRQAG